MKTNFYFIEWIHTIESAFRHIKTSKLRNLISGHNQGRIDLTMA